jgi:TolB-like protein
LQLIGGALASLAAVGAIAGGLVGYWNVWKTLRTDVFPESQKTQKEATARPDIVPRLSLVVLPFANLNNDPEQNYFADSITTDLTTDLAQMPGAFVIGRGTAFTYKNKQIDLRHSAGARHPMGSPRGAAQRDQVRSTYPPDLRGRDVWSIAPTAITNVAALQDRITARPSRC